MTDHIEDALRQARQLLRVAVSKLNDDHSHVVVVCSGQDPDEPEKDIGGVFFVGHGAYQYSIEVGAREAQKVSNVLDVPLEGDFYPRPTTDPGADNRRN